MRNYTKRFFVLPKIGLQALILLGFSLILGCKKDEESTPKYANLMFIHAIPDAASMDLYVDKSDAGKNIAFGDASPYIKVTAGKHLITTMEAGTIVEKVNSNHVFEGDKNFSVIGMNRNNEPQSILLTDTVGTPPAGKFWVRYVNLSPIATNTAYVIRISGSTNIWEFGETNYKAATFYRQYDPGTYSFDAANTKVSSGTPAATTGAHNFEAGRIYNLILTGTAGQPAPFDLKLKVVAVK